MTKEYSPVKSAITSSQVAGELYRASGIARQLSLAAKNSQAVVHRAGSKVAGLKVISEYFADLATKTIRLAEEINSISLDISYHNKVHCCAFGSDAYQSECLTNGFSRLELIKP